MLLRWPRARAGIPGVVLVLSAALAQPLGGEEPRVLGTGTLVQLTCESAGPRGLTIDVRTPQAPRRQDRGAPVVIVVPAGFAPGGFAPGSGQDFTHHGFVVIRVALPGHPLTRGTYDHHGPACARAVAAAVSFASGRTTAIDGRSLSQVTFPIPVDRGNVGLLGLGNGGNLALQTIASFQGKDGGSPVAWLANFESPVGEGMANGECGAPPRKGRPPGPQPGMAYFTNPPLNPAYDPATGNWSFDRLAWSPEVEALPAGESFSLKPRTLRTPHGGFYIDVDRNGRIDEGKDFVFRAVATQEAKGPVFMFSPRVLEAAEKRGIYPPGGRPAHLPGASEARAFWDARDGLPAIPRAVQANPALRFTVIATRDDHLLAAPDHPHVILQYEAVRAAGARVTRFNPGRAAVEKILGRQVAGLPDVPPGSPVTRANLAAALAPAGDPTARELQAAAIAELSDS